MINPNASRQYRTQRSSRPDVRPDVSVLRNATMGREFLGACLSISRGRDRGRFPLRQGGADAVGYAPNKEATTPHEGKSARSRRVGKERGVCGVARLARGTTTGG